MSLVVLERVNLSFGAQYVLRDAGLRIDGGERIGLVGPNGAGKSSLLRLITQQLTPDSGEVRFMRNVRIGYLPQDVDELPADTVLEAVLASVPGLQELEGLLEQAEADLMETHDVDEQMALAQRLADLGEQLGHFETFYSEHQAIRILRGLGFEQSELHRPTAELSGGWRMRVALAGLLFQQPDVLLMDEPTNHLDLPSVLWLDGFLNELRGALVLICHDRDFLNRHIRRVVSFEPEGLRTYTGNYDSYLKQRDVELEVLDARDKNREREIRDLSKFVERFKAKATKARQAQSRAKQVKKLQAEMNAERRPGGRRTLSFRFPEVPHTGRDVVRIEGLNKSFGAIRLYDNLTAGIYAGDRIAIIGRNGAGKTTLLRMLANEIKADSGDIRFGSGVQLGYYAQHHSDLLYESDTAIDAVRRVSPAAGESFVRGVLGAFLFSGDEVEKVIGVLSGGERARVLLARLLVNPGNFLLMDEPTNHLDVAAAEALATALESYSGTLAFVSHNTAFCNRLATRVWDVSNGGIIDYPGTLTEYLAHAARLEAEAAEATPTPQSKAKSESKPKPKVSPAPKSPQPKPQKQAKPERSVPSKPRPGRRGPPVITPVETKAESTVRRRRRGRDEATPVKPTEGSVPAPAVTPVSDDASSSLPSGRASRRGRNRSRRQGLGANQVAELNDRLSDLKDEAKTVEADLADPSFYSDQSRFQKSLRRFNEIGEEIARVEARLKGA
ncbi:MAG: ATP-binding cassette subfamily F protein 3 [Myxococcota bacterium]